MLKFGMEFFFFAVPVSTNALLPTQILYLFGVAFSHCHLAVQLPYHVSWVAPDLS